MFGEYYSQKLYTKVFRQSISLHYLRAALEESSQSQLSEMYFNSNTTDIRIRISFFNS